MNSTFPTLSLPAPFPFAGGGGGGTSTWRTQPCFGEEWGAEAEILNSLFKARGFGGSRVPAFELFGGLGILRSEAAELPLPPSREPDLAAAIFIPFLPRIVFLFSVWILIV